MDEIYEAEPKWTFPDLITPEALVQKFAEKGILISERTLRDIARRLGAFRVIGKTMFFMPEDLEAILEDARPKPRQQQVGKFAAVEGGPSDIATEQLLERLAKAKSKPSQSKPAKTVFDEQRAVFTPAMVAKRWGCSERHVRNLVDSGKLPSFRLGGKLIRIRAVDVETVEKLLEDSGLAEADTNGQATISAGQPAAKRPRAKRLDR